MGQELNETTVRSYCRCIEVHIKRCDLLDETYSVSTPIR